MQLTIERAALLKALGHVQSVVERRNTVPILSNVLLSADRDAMALSATDLDMEIVDETPGRVDGQGQITAPAHTLYEIVRKLPEGAEVLDFGCGSGILALAAARLGARHVVAYDIDPQALLATRQNAEANGLLAQISVCASAAELPLHTGIILANILAGTLESLASQFARQLTRGGRLLLAGILAEQADAVTGAYAPWFDIRLAGERQEWVALEGIRSGNVHGLS